MCKRDASDPGTGLAAIFVTNSVDIESIEWDVNGAIVTGPVLSGVDAGILSRNCYDEVGLRSDQGIPGLFFMMYSVPVYHIVPAIRSFPLLTSR